MSTTVVQIGLCTADVAATTRRYCEGFGFIDAGGRMMWGPRSASIQKVGPDTTGAIWWLVGNQTFLNLELFRHSLPAQRPLPADWKPNVLGWVRWGFAVADFDAAVAYLDKVGLPHSEVAVVDGLRRVCFRDPDFGTVVEVMEEGVALPGADVSPATQAAPRLVYVTLSVPDLAAARTFYADAMEMRPIAQQLHTPQMEALWGLPGAARETAVLDGGRGMFLELVQYAQPGGQSRPDLLLSDQGVMNMAIGYRERPDAERAIERAVAAGGALNAPLGNADAAATYVRDPMGNSLELCWVPESRDEAYGWTARPPAYR